MTISRPTILHSFLALVSSLVVLVGSTAVAAPPPEYNGGPGWWRISPRATFYRTANDPQAETSAFFILAELPFDSLSVPLTIQVFGDYKRTAAAGDTEKVLHGVFTKTPTILVATLQRRLPDAVTAPSGLVISGPTYHQSLPTDIPEDFRTSPDASGKYKIMIPASAQWIAVCVPDSYYSDNSDPDDDLWIRFSRQ
jgi:hypothetical protein